MNRFYTSLLISLSFFAWSHTTDNQSINLIESIIISKHKVMVKPNDWFKKSYLRDNFFAEYDNDIDLTQLDHSLVVMPFLMNVISIIWISGKEYTIDELDEDLFQSLKIIKEIFKRMYPKTSWEGNLIPKKLVNHAKKAQEEIHKNRVALMFSAGLDSTFSSFLHYDQKQLLITACGLPDNPLKNQQKWNSMQNYIMNFAKHNGQIVTFIRSNFSDFLNWDALHRLSSEIDQWRIDTIEGIGWAGLAAPILYTHGYSRLLHSAADTWEYLFPNASKPIIDDNISFAGVRLSHVGYDHTRVEKCEFINRLCRSRQIEKPYIRVCKSFNNCCRCLKCIRTINSLLAADADHTLYGFPIELSEVTALTKKHLHPLSLVIDWLHDLKDIKYYVGKRIQKGYTPSAYIQWLYEKGIDVEEIDKVIANVKRSKGKTKMDWNKFVEFYPNIPKHLLEQKKEKGTFITFLSLLLEKFKARVLPSSL